jgi:C4-dicarboxylate-specific signal transduction histidine kinase
MMIASGARATAAGRMAGRGYAFAFLFSGVAWLIAWVLGAPSSCFLLAVVAASLFAGRGPAYAVIVTASVLFELFFLPPRFHLTHEKQAWLRWGVFVGTMVLTEALLNAKRRVEDSLRRTEARLAQAAQHAAVSELAAAIVHEISQPLSAMVTNGQACLRWLSSDPPNTGEGIASVERIVRDGRDAAEIVRGLRSVFRRSAPEKVSLDFSQIVSEVVSLMRPRAQREGIWLEADVSRDLPSIQGDKIQLQQVLMNLVVNSMDALHQAGGQRSHVTIRVRREKSALAAEVLDNGPHSPDFETIFDPFVTTKAEGMGMGLAICRSIVNAHGGRIWGEARGNGGTAFIFTLPLEADNHA